MHHFCTYFDHRYLPRGLALYRSLTTHCRSFQLWILCLDRKAFEVLDQLGLPHLRLIALEDLELQDPELLRVKSSRTPVEYYFTCTPALPWFVLRTQPDVDAITYLDADLFFFADPELILREMAGESVAIIEHRFAARLRGREKYGVYNVGWVSFRRDENGMNCLRWWRERCLEWCHDRAEEGRFADQKYLDEFPARFPGVVVVRQKGANVAPWNFVNYRIRHEGGRTWIDDDPLVFYHFHDLKQISRRVYDPSLGQYECRLSRMLTRHVYMPYIQILTETRRQVEGLLSETVLTNRYDLNGTPQAATPSSFREQVIGAVKNFFQLGKGLLRRRYILVWGDAVARENRSVLSNEDRIVNVAP